MPEKKNDIIAQLQREILPLQGFKSLLKSNVVDVGLGTIEKSFPDARFPLGAVHEFFCTCAEQAAATEGFVSGILSSLMRGGRVSLWITSSRTVFPPALKNFGIQPDRIIFIYLQKEKDILWAMEEALRCEGLAAVVGEIQELGFTASRRLQLAVEQSRVTGFIIRRNPKNLTTACVTRWRITSIPSVLADNIPGVGFSRWKVELLKVRNGRTGNWELEWTAGKFRQIINVPLSIEEALQRKTG